MERINMIDEAVRLAEKGFSVIPLHGISGNEGNYICNCWKKASCTTPGKHPIESDWKNKIYRNEKDIRSTWKQEYNIGIATGPVSNLLVVDIDGEDGCNSMDMLEDRYGKLTDTLKATSGRGYHLYFKHPGINIGNKVKFENGLDVRDQGGLIVAPPSLHHSGKCYQWVDPEESMAPMPEWLVKHIGESVAKSKNDRKHECRHSSSGGGQIQEGGRNSTLFSEACRLRCLGYEEKIIEVMLQVINEERCSTPLDEDEVSRIAQSACTYDANVFAMRNYTDAGNAAVMAELYRDKIHYVGPWNDFIIFDGKRWRRDERNEAAMMAKDMLKQWHICAVDGKDSKEEAVKHILRSENQSRIDAMLKSLRSEPGIPLIPSQLDQDPWLFNVRNGTIDLRTGKLQAHEPARLMTKMADVDYDPNAECPEWEKFLRGVFNGDEELIRYLQLAAGYALTGDCSEQCIFIFYGDGANGKSTLVNTLMKITGDYSQQIDVESLLVKKNEGISNDIACLQGARLVSASESESGRRLAEAKIKQLSAGNDKIKARFLYGEHFEFIPTFKLVLSTNHKPAIRGTDDGIWRRIRLVPFVVTFLDPARHADIPEGRAQDKNLGRKLDTELSGILNWALEGCLIWQREGMFIPRAIQEATTDYRNEMDVLTGFIKDECIKEAGKKVGVTDLYHAYKLWCEEHGEFVLKCSAFSNEMVARGYDRRRSGAGGATELHGIDLIKEQPLKGLQRLNGRASQMEQMVN